MLQAGQELNVSPVFDYKTLRWFSRPLCPCAASQDEFNHELTSNSGSESGETPYNFEGTNTGYHHFEPIALVENSGANFDHPFSSFSTSNQLADHLFMDLPIPSQESHLRTDATQQRQFSNGHPPTSAVPVDAVELANTLSHHRSLYNGPFAGIVPTANLTMDGNDGMQVIEQPGGDHALHPSSSSSPSSGSSMTLFDTHPHPSQSRSQTRGYEASNLRPSAPLPIPTSEIPSYHLATYPPRHPSNYTNGTAANDLPSTSSVPVDELSQSFTAHSVVASGHGGRYEPNVLFHSDGPEKEEGDHIEDEDMDASTLMQMPAQTQTQTPRRRRSPAKSAHGWEGPSELAEPYRQLLACGELAAGTQIPCEYLDPFLEVNRLPDSKSGKGSKNGAESYTCRFPYCKKKTVRRDHARDHIATHVGSRPHRCDDCGQTFLRPADRKRHHIRACRTARMKPKSTKPASATSTLSLTANDEWDSNMNDIGVDGPAPTTAAATPVASAAGAVSGVGIAVDSPSSTSSFEATKLMLMADAPRDEEDAIVDEDDDGQEEQGEQEEYSYQYPMQGEYPEYGGYPRHERIVRGGKSL